MDPDILDDIEEVYESSNSKDAKVIRVLLQEIRRLQRELETLTDTY